MKARESFDPHTYTLTTLLSGSAQLSSAELVGYLQTTRAPCRTVEVVGESFEWPFFLHTNAIYWVGCGGGRV